MKQNSPNCSNHLTEEIDGLQNKMRKLSFLLAALIAVSFAQAQLDSSSSAPAQKKFIVIVKTMDNKFLAGKFHSVGDTQLLLIRSSDGLHSIPAENIRFFTLRRKNSVGRGALIGFGVGALTGIIIGFASGDDEIQEPSPNDPWGIGSAIHNAFAMTAGQKALVGGLSLGVGGTLVGIIIGAVAKRKFTIGGKKQKFRDLQAEIMAKIIQK